MKAIIYADDETLAKIQDMGVEVVCTKEQAIIPPPFMHSDVREKAEEYAKKQEKSKYRTALLKSEKRMDELMEDIIYRMEKALGYDGSLNWSEAEDCISECYEKRAIDYDHKHSAAR